MILEIDVGNTRIKWRTLQNGGTCDRGALPKEELEKWLLDMGQQKVPGKVRFSCVANRDIVKKLAEQVSQWGCPLQEATTSHDAAGVCCGYDDPGTLGVDRWLAVVAAFNEFSRPCVVVDAGSAVTVDIVNGDGQHLGGYIVPGLGMMRQSLFEGTSQVKVDDFTEESIEPGCSTKQAVANGSLLMIKAMIESATELLKSEIGSAQIVITGGDGDYLMKVLGDQAVSYTHLTLPTIYSV